MPGSSRKILVFATGCTLLALSALPAVAASCSYKDFFIGYEISAIAGPIPSGEYLFALSPLRCDSTGTVVYTDSIGFSDGHEIG